MRLTGISSMATRALLADLAADYQARHGVELVIESVAGVDAARRVQAGEAFDFVVLAADAITRLIASGQVVAGSRVDLVSSGVAVAVPSSSLGPGLGPGPRSGSSPDISTEDAVRRAVLAAPSIGYSTGPSGVQLLKLFDRWGITAQLQLQGRLVQAPAGVPVASLVARGEVALGFQQLSELLNTAGITVLGPLPAAIQINTIFSAGLCTTSAQADAVRMLFNCLISPTATPAKQLHGMAPA